MKKRHPRFPVPKLPPAGYPGGSKDPSTPYSGTQEPYHVDPSQVRHLVATGVHANAEFHLTNVKPWILSAYPVSDLARATAHEIVHYLTKSGDESHDARPWNLFAPGGTQGTLPEGDSFKRDLDDKYRKLMDFNLVSPNDPQA